MAKRPSRAKAAVDQESLIEYFRERSDLLRMYAVEVAGPNPQNGVDIVLRIDGTYYGALANGEEIEQQLHYSRTRLLSAFAASGVDSANVEVGGRQWLHNKISQFRKETFGSEALAWSAGEIVSTGQCSGSCMVAGGPSVSCDCNCGGQYHGALNAVTVSSPLDRDTP
jgi:hypothetical protein